MRDILADKHSPGQPDTIISDYPADVHPVLFGSLDAAMIRSAALHTNGSAGPSGLDALGSGGSRNLAKGCLSTSCFHW